MNTVAVNVPRIAATTLISVCVCLGFSAFPSSVDADINTVETRAVISTQANACTPLSAHSFNQYVYNGELHSFEFTISDTSYVAISATVGNQTIPFQQITRKGSAGNLRIHVDVASTPLIGSVPLSVTLLSAAGGTQTICMSVVGMTTASTLGQIPVTPVAPVTPTTPVTPVVPTTPSVQPSTPVKPSTPVTPSSTPSSTTTAPSSGGQGTTTSTTTSPSGGGVSSAITGIQNRIVEVCLEGQSPRLWIILLGVFALIASIAGLIQLPTPQKYSVGQRTATVVVPLLLLALFWFFSEACRVGLWAPLIALGIALVSLVFIFRDEAYVAPYVQRVKGFFTEEETPKKPGETNNTKALITPPPTKKQGE